MKQTPPHTIRLKLQNDGTLTAKVEGISGPGCQGVTDWLAALGEIIEDKKTGDFYNLATTTAKTTVGRGW